jgi:hypothetical protein
MVHGDGPQCADTTAVAGRESAAGQWFLIGDASLGWNPSSWRRLTDIDAELEKLAVDAWRSLEWICDAHFPDELACFQWYRRPATMASRLPALSTAGNLRDASEQ